MESPAIPGRFRLSSNTFTFRVVKTVKTGSKPRLGVSAFRVGYNTPDRSLAAPWQVNDALQVVGYAAQFRTNLSSLC